MEKSQLIDKSRTEFNVERDLNRKNRIYRIITFICVDLFLYFLFSLSPDFKQSVQILMNVLYIDKIIAEIIVFLILTIFLISFAFLVHLWNTQHVSYNKIETIFFNISVVINKFLKLLKSIEIFFFSIFELIKLYFLIILMITFLSLGLVSFFYGLLLVSIFFMILFGLSSIILDLLSLDFFLSCSIAYLRVSNNLSRRNQTEYKFKLRKVSKKYEVNQVNRITIPEIKDRIRISFNNKSLSIKKYKNPKTPLKETYVQLKRQFKESEIPVTIALIVALSFYTFFSYFLQMEALESIVVIIFLYFFIGLPFVIASKFYAQLALLNTNEEGKPLDDVFEDTSFFTGGNNPKLAKVILNYFLLAIFLPLFNLPLLSKIIFAIIVLIPLTAIFSHLLIAFFISLSYGFLGNIQQKIGLKVNQSKLKLIQRNEFEWVE